MTALEQLMAALDSQVENLDQVEKGNWPRCTYQLTREEDGGTKVTLESQEVGFIFCTEGNLVGMFNWKE